MRRASVDVPVAPVAPSLAQVEEGQTGGAGAHPEAQDARPSSEPNPGQTLDLLDYVLSFVYFSSARQSGDSASSSSSCSSGGLDSSCYIDEEEEEEELAVVTEQDMAYQHGKECDRTELAGKNQERFGGLRLVGLDGLAMPFNSAQPVSFVTPTFHGSLLFLVRPSTSHAHSSDPYTPYLESRRYHFEMRIQGKFTRPPQGTLMMGAELPRHVRLSMLTRPLANMVLALGSTLVQGLHYSFGEGTATKPEGHQSPHCTWPVWTGMDRVVVTPAGEAAPSLLEPVPESNEDRTIRRAAPLDAAQPSPFVVGPTYTLSFASGLLDPMSWRFASGSLSLDMTSFLGDLPLQIVVYDLLAAKAQGDAHVSVAKRYQFFAELVPPHAKNRSSNGDGTHRPRSTTPSRGHASKAKRRRSISQSILVQPKEKEHDDEEQGGNAASPRMASGAGVVENEQSQQQSPTQHAFDVLKLLKLSSLRHVTRHRRRRRHHTTHHHHHHGHHHHGQDPLHAEGRDALPRRRRLSRRAKRFLAIALVLVVLGIALAVALRLVLTTNSSNK